MKGIGIDLCEIARIERTMEKTEGFLKKYYTEEERAYIESRGKAGAQSAAAMLAAKEAVLKAVGAGIGGGVALNEVSVIHRESGAPLYLLTGKALEKLHERGAQLALLSLTHEAGVAAAVCVIE